MSLELAIINRAGWPDWFIKPICKWIAKRAGIDRKYKIIIRNTSNRLNRCGSGGWNSQRSTMNRRYRWRLSTATSSPYWRKATGVSGYPYEETYHRYAWAKKFQINNPMEALIHLIAHECGHATVGQRHEYKGPDGKCDVAAMEMACENLAHETVEEFRKLWRTRFRPAMMSKLRADRQRQRTAHMKIAPSAFAVHCMKRDKAQAALERWEKKAKIAATYIKKYRRRLNYYQGRMAANTGD